MRRKRDPLNVGVDMSLLGGDTLNQRQMFLKNSFEPPLRISQGIDVIVPGKIPRRVTRDKLEAFFEVELDLVLECAGNGRALMEPRPRGTRWRLEGVSPISVVGVRLADVLGPLPERVSTVVFTGGDKGPVPFEGEVNYQYGISRDLALSNVPLLISHINKEPLTMEHGGPVRLVVPGHYGHKSVKWLTRIEAVEYQFQGHFQKKYRYFQDTAHPDGTPVGEIAVRSVISSPIEGASLYADTIDVRGSAWTGVGEVDSVEVSADEGRTWQPAALVTHSTGGRFAPVHWAAAIELKPGPAVLMVRATDTSGATQPLESRWNTGGFGNNVVHRVHVEVV